MLQLARDEKRTILIVRMCKIKNRLSRVYFIILFHINLMTFTYLIIGSS